MYTQEFRNRSAAVLSKQRYSGLKTGYGTLPLGAAHAQGQSNTGLVSLMRRALEFENTLFEDHEGEKNKAELELLLNLHVDP